VNDLALPTVPPAAPSGTALPPPEHLPVAVIGAGFGGIALAVQLRKAGIEDFTILERAATFGGTWRDNDYPGAACDVPSVLYSYSFAPNPDWSRKYGQQPEILAYLKGVVREFDLERHVRYDSELLSARWDDAAQHWRLETRSGRYTAGVLVTACGPFNDPLIPELPGRERFRGASFHTARWDHTQDLAGKRVAVIGTGASAIQVVPAIQPQVSRLKVFQRTPTWIVPRADRRTGVMERWLMRLPPLRRAIRSGWFLGIESLGLSLFVDQRLVWPFEALGRFQLRRQVRDPEWREKLKPNFRLGCKRAVFSDAWYPALQQPNVDLVTSGIREIREGSILTGDGVEHAVDTIIYATGFHVPGLIFQRLYGRDGRSLSGHFNGVPYSYLGTCFHGFPNLFSMLGPFSGAGNQSAVYMLENQATYITDAVRTLRERGLSSVEPSAASEREFRAEMLDRSRRTTWVTGGCQSYYQNAQGGNAGLWPNWSFRYRQRTQRFDIENYVLHTKARVFS